jgi:diguanylate cyclase
MLLEVRRMQAATMVRRLPTTVFGNTTLTLSAFALVLAEHALDSAAIWWLCLTLGSLALRFVTGCVLVHINLAHHHPQLALRLLTVTTAASGLAWGALPFCVDAFNAFGVESGLYVIMLGASAGSVMLSLGYSWISIVFSLPSYISVIISLAMHGGLVGCILSINVVGLAIILLRSSKNGETMFTDSAVRKLQATKMTNSLSAANADIMQANARLELLVSCDPLTGLANRTAFNAALQQGIEDARNGNGRLALLVIDLDRFKHVNDTMGHRIGDALLTEFGMRIRNKLAPSGTLIARLGGDEFAVIMSGADIGNDAVRAAEAILYQGRRPFLLDGQTCTVGTSVGLAFFPDHATTAEELFVSADMALYSSKEQGRGCWRMFDPKLRAAAERQRQIECDIPGAIESGELVAWFQPQVSLADERIIGFEALVRWHHPTLGFIAPPEIVQAAHAVHLSHRLTGTIANAACLLLRRLPELGLPDATVAVNVSPREFALYSVAELLDKVVARHQIRPQLLEIEITEEALLDTVIAGEQLKRLEKSGFALAVDDFGAGHSSLTRLIDLKVDRLKIDRGIITQIAASERNQAIVSALIRLSDALSMDMLAEGVETEADAAALLSLGCGLGQGYLFARPMPMAHLEAWIGKRDTTRRTRAVA